jgi:hypothetical protein
MSKAPIEHWENGHSLQTLHKMPSVIVLDKCDWKLISANDEKSMTTGDRGLERMKAK